MDIQFFLLLLVWPLSNDDAQATVHIGRFVLDTAVDLPVVPFPAMSERVLRFLSTFNSFVSFRRIVSTNVCNPLLAILVVDLCKRRLNFSFFFFPSPTLLLRCIIMCCGAVATLLLYRTVVKAGGRREGNSRSGSQGDRSSRNDREGSHSDHTEEEANGTYHRIHQVCVFLFFFLLSEVVFGVLMLSGWFSSGVTAAVVLVVKPTS